MYWRSTGVAGSATRWAPCAVASVAHRIEDPARYVARGRENMRSVAPVEVVMLLNIHVGIVSTISRCEEGRFFHVSAAGEETQYRRRLRPAKRISNRKRKSNRL